MASKRGAQRFTLAELRLIAETCSASAFKDYMQRTDSRIRRWQGIAVKALALTAQQRADRRKGRGRG